LQARRRRMMSVMAGLLVLNLGLQLAQALAPLVPQHAGSGDVTGKIQHLTKAATSASACPGKS
jgi:hypothetical protein